MKNMEMRQESMDMEEPQIEFRKIKLKYEMKAVYAIKQVIGDG